MKTYLFILLTFFAGFSAFSSESTEVSCELKRDDWDRMNFEFRFLSSKRAIAIAHFQKNETTTNRNIPVSAIHESSEARYVGLNFLNEEKLVFIFLTPIFAPENLGTSTDIEVVSSIYGPLHLNCRTTK